MIERKLPKQAFLHECFDYDPITGIAHAAAYGEAAKKHFGEFARVA
jgi:hypothetical protein